MKVQIAIERAAAIRAGRDTYGKIIVDINPADLNAEEREALIGAPEQNGVTDLTDTNAYGCRGSYAEPPLAEHAEDLNAAVHAWLAWRRECDRDLDRREAARREEDAENARRAEEAAEAYLAFWREQPAERFIDRHGGGKGNSPYAFPDDVHIPDSDVPGEPGLRDVAMFTGLDPEAFFKMRERLEEGLADKLEEARAIVGREFREKRERETRARREQEQAAVRHAEQLSAWVHEQGDDNMVGRFKLGVLPENEVVDAIRSTAYASLDELPRHRKIRASDIEHTHGCLGSDASLNCGTADAKALDATLTAREYENYRQIEEHCPVGSTLEIVAHSCECVFCGAGVLRKSVRVAVSVGELAFTREYALDADRSP